MTGLHVGRHFTGQPPLTRVVAQLYSKDVEKGGRAIQQLRPPRTSQIHEAHITQAAYTSRNSHQYGKLRRQSQPSDSNSRGEHQVTRGNHQAGQRNFGRRGKNQQTVMGYVKGKQRRLQGGPQKFNRQVGHQPQFQGQLPTAHRLPATKAKRLLNAMLRLGNANGGMNPRALRSLYKGAI